MFDTGERRVFSETQSANVHVHAYRVVGLCIIYPRGDRNNARWMRRFRRAIAARTGAACDDELDDGAPARWAVGGDFPLDYIACRSRDFEAPAAFFQSHEVPVEATDLATVGCHGFEQAVAVRGPS